MTARRTAFLAAVSLTAAAVALAPAATASTHAHATKVKPKFVVSKLSIAHYKKVVDVANADATVKIKVQVKDHSKNFNPTSVRLAITEQPSGDEKTTFVLKTKLVGKSKVVSNWKGTLTVPQGSVDPGASVKYCVKLVKVNDSDPSTLPVVKTAKGLAGRDCFTVVNTAVVPTA